jgi:plasmid replication initiation protein
MVSNSTSKQGMLLPERHSKKELFLCDIGDAVLKDDIASMEHPIFSLSKKTDITIRNYENDNVRIEVIPSIKGLATIYDKDILIYAISKIMAAKNRGEKPGRKVVMSARDLLVFMNRPTGGSQYERLKTSFIRLNGTLITTNIKTGDEEQFSSFNLIDETMIRKSDKTGRVIEWGITLSKWLFNAIEANEVLTLHPDYFRLRKPLERRVYELGRKHCGANREWKINLELLKKKSGSLSPLKHFKYLIKDIVKNNHLPDYSLDMDDNDIVTFTRKHTSRAGDLFSYQETRPGIPYTVDSLDRFLDPRAQEKCPKLAREKGIDYYYIKNEFCNFLNTKGAPDNISASFIGFIKQKKIS